MQVVRLTPRDLDLLIDVFQQVTDYKQRTLQRHNWRVFETEYLPRLVDYISRNEFPVNDPANSIFTWIIDQICHSHKIISGVPLDQGLPLCDTKLGQRVIEICRHAQRGQSTYDLWAQPTKYSDLFDEV